MSDQSVKRFPVLIKKASYIVQCQSLYIYISPRHKAWDRSLVFKAPTPGQGSRRSPLRIPKLVSLRRFSPPRRGFFEHPFLGRISQLQAYLSARIPKEHEEESRGREGHLQS